jgi:hypothetical protein
MSRERPKISVDPEASMSGNPAEVGWGVDMSRNALSVSSEILSLRVLIGDALIALRGGKNAPAFPVARRRSLSRSFRQYGEPNQKDRLMSNAVWDAAGGTAPLPSQVIRKELEQNGPKVLKVMDRYAAGKLNPGEASGLIEFLSRVDVALNQSGANLSISRYL